jgi:hypothetical protein
MVQTIVEVPVTDGYIKYRLIYDWRCNFLIDRFYYRSHSAAGMSCRFRSLNFITESVRESFGELYSKALSSLFEALGDIE